MTNGATIILSRYFITSWIITLFKMSVRIIFRGWNYQATETWGRARQHREKLQESQKKIPKIPTWWIFTRFATLSTAVPQRLDESLRSLVFALVFFLSKSPVEKTSSEYCFGTLLSPTAAIFTNVNYAINTLRRKLRWPIEDMPHCFFYLAIKSKHRAINDKLSRDKCKLSCDKWKIIAR